MSADFKEKKRERKKPIRPKNPPKKKFDKVRALHCFHEVEGMLKSGYPCGGIAKFVQEERHEFKHVQQRTLTQLLSAYKSEELKPVQLIAPHATEAVIQALKTFDNEMEDLERLDWLYTIQRTRLMMGYSRELMLRERDGTLGVEIDRLKGISKQMHEIKMDLGMTELGGRQLGTVVLKPEVIGDAREQYGDEVSDSLLKPEGRGRVEGVLEKIRRMGAKDAEVIDAEYVDN